MNNFIIDKCFFLLYLLYDYLNIKFKNLYNLLNIKLKYILW